MKTHNDKGKTILIVTALLLGLGGLTATTIFASQKLQNKYQKDAPSVSLVSSYTPNPGTSKSSEAPLTSSTHEQSDNDVPAINCSTPHEVYWYNTEDQIELNETMFVATINGLPSDASENEKELYFWSDDEDLDEWIELSVMRNGEKVVLNSPYSFQSGETVHAKQIRKAPSNGFYKIPLWIYAVNYEPEEVFNCIDFWFYQQ